MVPSEKPFTLAVFASDQGPGDAERASIMSQVGTYFARRGAGLVCLAEGEFVSAPLVTAARASGGAVSILAGPDFVLPRGLAGVPVEHIGEEAARIARLQEQADAFVGLPGSMASAASLYMTWIGSRAGGGKPLVLLNRNRAFEAVRGFAVDVAARSRFDIDRIVQFADSVEDLWARAARMAGRRV